MTHDQRFGTVAALLAHIRHQHARPATGGTADRLIAAWSATVDG